MEKKRILVVDDEVGFTNLVKLNLERTGNFDVRVENSGIRAVETAREFKPDLILLDIVMPDKDGGEVLADLQKEPSMKNVFVIFITATLSIKGVEAHDGVIRGIPVLAKPLEPKKLIKRINQLLDL